MLAKSSRTTTRQAEGYVNSVFSSSSGTELPLIVESYGLLNDIFPFPSIVDAGHPIVNLQLANSIPLRGNNYNELFEISIYMLS